MHDDHVNDGAYICVEPEVGRELWRWSLPEATDDERRRRAEHLRICDSCRLERALAARTEHGVADGTYVLDRALRTAPRRWSRTLSWSAGGLLAAAVALLLLLPPVAPRTDGFRGDDTARFLRPVSGEVVPTAGATLRWRPVPGATRYQVRIERVDGGLVWSGETTTTTLRLPAEQTLPTGTDLRAALVPTPRDLALPAGSTVRFRSGSSAAVVRYRLAAAPAPARWLLLAAVLSAGAALVLRRRASADPG